jgi:hypothetical protein
VTVAPKAPEAEKNRAQVASLVAQARNNRVRVAHPVAEVVVNRAQVAPLMLTNPLAKAAEVVINNSAVCTNRLGKNGVRAT